MRGNRRGVQQVSMGASFRRAQANGIRTVFLVFGMVGAIILLFDGPVWLQVVIALCIPFASFFMLRAAWRTSREGRVN
jgi:hypothetical protein